MPEYDPEPEPLEEVGDELTPESLQPVAQVEDAPEREAISAEETKVVRRVRNLLNDSLNRLRREREASQAQPSATTLLIDPMLTPETAVRLLENRVIRKDGIIQACESSLESIRQEVDTLERTIRQRGGTR